MKRRGNRISCRAFRTIGVTILLLGMVWGAVPPGAVEAQAFQEGDSQVAAEESPKLVVMLIVDQLRGDLLHRYSSLFQGGLRRLLDQGLYYSNALHAHSATETSPGHATISTGVYPARAAIPSNAWRERDEGQLSTVYNVVDPNYALVGVPGLPGSSPSVLSRKGLADWILDADQEAIVLSVSAKDRGAVLMAGQTKGNVFWFNSTAGRFVTSTFYRSRNPSWLSNFNEQVLEKFRADSVWVSTIPPEVAHLSAPDTADFEGDGVHTFFPHHYSQERIDPGMDDFFLWFETVPMLDDATLSLARLAMMETKAGTRPGRTDYLSVSLSQTDRVGHDYGPLSREQMDNLLRLDRSLGVFLDFLDKQVGRGDYVLGLTSDHGAMTSPERMEVPGVRLSRTERSALERALGEASRSANRAGNSSLAPFIVETIKEMPFVGPTFTQEELQTAAGADTIKALFQGSVVPGRFGGLLSTFGVEMWWAENTLDWSYPTGTTHGSPYYYDRWVPLILAGPGIEAGTVDRPVRPMDLAPTLAWLAGIPFPEDLDGEVLMEGRTRSPGSPPRQR